MNINDILIHMTYSEDYTKADADADAFEDQKASLEKDLIASDPEYAWKKRVSDAVHTKARALYDCHRKMGITDMTEVYKLHAKVKHLDKWLKEQLDEEIDGAMDAAAEARDPYGYRGLSRSDFL